MAGFDLKPLTAETIKDLKLKSDQLWEIKIDENIYGPFESKQLRHYSKENKQLLLRAQVSLMSVDNWRPFFEVREFIHEGDYSGPYWMLLHGRKSSPLSVEEIAKRIELGTIKRHDEISEDDGRHWHRISSHPMFEAHFTTGNTLPRLPQEASFQKSREKVLEQLENKASWTEEKESIASLTHVSLARKEKTRTVQVEEIKPVLPKPEKTESFWAQHSKYFYFATPVLAIALYFAFGRPAPTSQTAAVDGEEKSVTFKGGRKTSGKDRWSRSPANDGSSYDDRSPVTQTAPGDDYPTVIETHQEDNYPDPSAEADQVAEIQDQENSAQENNLVQQQPNRDPAQDGGESLDATMNNEAQEQPNPAVDVPVVEEVSDF